MDYDFIFFCFSLANLIAHFFALPNGGEAEWLECVSDTLIEFTHELDPKIKQQNTMFSN